LNRDLGLDVTGGVDLAVRGHQRDAVQAWIDLGERRNVVGILALFQILVFGERGIDDRLRVGLRRRRYRQNDRRRDTDQPRMASRSKDAHHH